MITSAPAIQKSRGRLRTEGDMTVEPKWLTEESDRKMARYIRDRQWEMLELIALHNPLYICWWDKAGRYKVKTDTPPDVWSCGLIDGMGTVRWLKAHPDWTQIGEWSDERYAAPVHITDSGRDALANRECYDMEPVREAW